MSAKSKLELILELKNKLFNTKLKRTKNAYINANRKMRKSVDKLKMKHIAAFKAMRTEFPILGRAADLLSNKYVLMGAGIATVGALLFNAGKKAAAFNHEFLQIQNLNLDKSKSQLTQYKKTIEDTAFTLGTDLNQTTTAFYDVQSATGLFGEEAKKVVSAVGKFSIATGADLNDSINATTKAMKAFGLGANDIEAYLESNAKTVQVGITTFKELARVQTEYAGAAAGAGQSVDTANKVFAAFTSIAKDSRTAATMTKTAFLGLTQKQTVKGLKEIGIEMYDAQGNMRNLDDVLKDVSAKFKTMSPKAIDETINKIGGPEGLRNLFIKLKTGADDFFNTMEAFDSSKFNLDKALKNAKGDITVLSGIVKNRFGVIMEKLGQLILPLVAKSLNWINNILVSGMNFYREYSDVLDLVAIAIGIVVTALAGFKIISWVVKLIKMWRAAQIGLNVVLTANPIGAIIMGITALIAAIVYVIKKTEGWKAQLNNLKQVFSLIWDGIKLQFQLFTQGMYSAWMWLQDGIVKGWKWAQNLIGKLSDEQYRKDIAKIDAEAKARKKALADTVNAIIDNGKKIKDTAQWKLKWKSDKTPKPDLKNATNPTADTQGILPVDITGNTNDAGSTATPADQIDKVTGTANQPRSIVINIESFIKGDVLMKNNNDQPITLDDLEDKLREMFGRMVRNVEMMGG